MNILFFLTPKVYVEYLNSEDTLRQAMEKMDFHNYTAIPVLDTNGEYFGTITEGDILRSIKNQTKNLQDTEKISIRDVARSHDHQAVKIDVSMDDLLTKVINQNFVPVVDDRNLFIGIITRRSIIQYCYGILVKEKKE